MRDIADFFGLATMPIVMYGGVYDYSFEVLARTHRSSFRRGPAVGRHVPSAVGALRPGTEQDEPRTGVPLALASISDAAESDRLRRRTWTQHTDIRNKSLNMLIRNDLRINSE